MIRVCSELIPPNVHWCCSSCHRDEEDGSNELLESYDSSGNIVAYVCCGVNENARWFITLLSRLFVTPTNRRAKP